MHERTLLVLSGGHPYDEPAFEALLAGLGDWSIRHLVHPDAEIAIAGGAADEADAMLFYDMAGYEFSDGEAKTRLPSAGFQEALLRRFARGHGAVMMHHALADWADWPEWSEIVGGRFLYTPGDVRGVPSLDSGYRHDVTYVAETVPGHPVTAGLPDCFEVTDELYLAEIFEDEVTALVRARHSFVAENFYSAAHAVAGRMFDNEDWPHPEGSSLIAWARYRGSAPIVYIQCGDGPESYGNANIGRLIANALEWTAASRREEQGRVL